MISCPILIKQFLLLFLKMVPDKIDRKNIIVP